ncbi:MAG: hypothetical protein QE265_04850 [Rhodoferax sp.]|nr:hypothetical protein [Rhodoferax sp.]
MNYHQTFDRLGNPVARPTKPDWQHRVIRWASGITIVVSLFILVWGR